MMSQFPGPGMTESLERIVRYLDDYLRVAEVPDDPRALNGLQVDGPAEVAGVLGAVDASVATIEAAAERGRCLLIVHHGLFWRGLQRLVGRIGERVPYLLERHGTLVELAVQLGRQQLQATNNVRV